MCCTGAAWRQPVRVRHGGVAFTAGPAGLALKLNSDSAMSLCAHMAPRVVVCTVCQHPSTAYKMRSASRGPLALLSSAAAGRSLPVPYICTCRMHWCIQQAWRAQLHVPSALWSFRGRQWSCASVVVSMLLASAGGATLPLKPLPAQRAPAGKRLRSTCQPHFNLRVFWSPCAPQSRTFAKSCPRLPVPCRGNELLTLWPGRSGPSATWQFEAVRPSPAGPRQNLVGPPIRLQVGWRGVWPLQCSRSWPVPLL